MLRALGLGDLLTGLPALRALRRALPDHELTLAAPRVLAPLVDLAAVADRLVDTPSLGPPPWRGGPPDVAVNLHGRGPQSHELLATLHPGRLVAFGCGQHRGPAWDPAEHETRRWCRLVEESLGGPADHRDLLLPAPDADTATPAAVVVHPGAAYPSRRWPADRFAAVARSLSASGQEVIVTGGPDEVALAQRVADAAGLPGRSVLAGRTDLLQLAAQVAAARLVVCGDTGVAHLATAFGTPSVLLFGPVPPALWGPVTDGPHRVLWHGRDDGTATGDPWGTRLDPALARISVPEVLIAAGTALADGVDGVRSGGPR